LRDFRLTVEVFTPIALFQKKIIKITYGALKPLQRKSKINPKNKKAGLEKAHGSTQFLVFGLPANGNLK